MKINLFSVPISITSKSQALALVGEWVKTWRIKQSPPAHSVFSIQNSVFPKIIFTPNPEIIVAAQNDPELLKALQSADLAIPDGIGVARAVKIRRLSGLDLMESLIRQPQKVSPFEPKLKIMLLGGRPGVAQKAAKILSEHSENSDGQNVRNSDNQKTGNSGSPNLRFSDSSGSPSLPSVLQIRAISGPKDITRVSKEELDELVNSINRFRPDLLFVAFGHPRQEKWLMVNRSRLNAGVAMAVGGAFDQIADPTLRPPIYINSIGLGWLYRLLRQPWRWRRQLALIKFVGMVVKEKIKNF